MKKFRILSFLLVVMLLSLTACSGSSEQSSGKSSDDSEGKIELTFWNIWTDPSPQNKASLKQVEKFMKEHPNIVIKQQNIPHDQYKVKLKTQAAGKQLPDLIQVWPGAELKPLVDGGLVQPLDDIVSNWDSLITNKDYLKDYQISGKQYAIPANVTPTSVVYYDKDMLAKVGYNEFPKTYEEFKTLIKKLKDSGTIPIALGNKAQWVLQSSYISTIGDRLTGSDFLKSVLETGKKKFTDEKFIKAVGIIKELADMGAFNDDFNSIDNNQHRDLFISGDAAMMIDGAWSLGPVLEAAPNKHIGLALFPQVDGGLGDPTAVSAVTGTGIAINSELKGEKLKAAQEFLKAFYGEDYYKNLMKADILVPANIEPPADISPQLKEMAELTSKKIAPVYDATLPTEVTDIINAGLQEVTLGTMTPEQLAKKLQEAVDKQK
ncbi:raffinose/stachyose/melibiose transport system substrate-binding protein [Anoxybacillus tepidamans]|uniref:Raffinose/stachyose/melibiose transport system substrate-binding protein n=1 Tax=Anoxybacteroides tepidamans TaxID=265948 RepID=A0A7W8MXK9_9BACL|nr:extracellular solute-binding protein [Anoxybacillus tepidamans]MBB5325740.1 raffinose/stachyose/melibiose transport system substrate-binding protein [Anoxybacillus tepidamans]